MDGYLHSRHGCFKLASQSLHPTLGRSTGEPTLDLSVSDPIDTEGGAGEVADEVTLP